MTLHKQTPVLINRLLASVERRVRADVILSIQTTTLNARSVKRLQREERAALTALIKHLKSSDS